MSTATYTHQHAPRNEYKAYLMDGCSAGKLEEAKSSFLIFFPHVLATSGLKRNNKMFVHWFYVISMTTFPVSVIAIVRNFRIGLRVDTSSWVHQFVIVLPTNTASDRNG